MYIWYFKSDFENTFLIVNDANDLVTMSLYGNECHWLVPGTGD